MAITLIKGNDTNLKHGKPFFHKDMPLAHQYCIGNGLELGAAAHNPFNLAGVLNVAPYSDDPDHYHYKNFQFYKQAQEELCGHYAQVDISGVADDIPVSDNSQDYIVNSHMIEHVTDVIGAFLEWNRVLKPGGVIFMIFPKRDALSTDVSRPITTVDEFVAIYRKRTSLSQQQREHDTGHKHVFSLQSMIDLINWCNENLSLSWVIEATEETDSKTINGHTVVARYMPVNANQSLAASGVRPVPKVPLPARITDKVELQEKFEQFGPWLTRFEINGEAYGGNFDASNDLRVQQFGKKFPNAKTVMELGSLEGGHTIALSRLPGVEYVLGIEGRDFNLERARFVQSQIGIHNLDFVQANLETTDLTQYGHFDAVFCSGLLYHLPQPWLLVEQMSRVAPNLFIWTHFVADEKANTTINGYQGWYFKESGYADPLSGLSNDSFWPTYESLLQMLRKHGYDDIDVLSTNADHPHGPGIILVARQTKPSGPAYRAKSTPRPAQPVNMHSSFPIGGSRPLREDEALIFVHISKTGGLTLLPILDEMFPPDQIMKAHHEGAIHEELITDSGQYRLIRGHIYKDIRDKLTQPYIFITMLRNPVERARSVYQHIINHPVHGLYPIISKLTFREYVFSEDLNIKIDILNSQTRVITNMLDILVQPDLELAKQRLRDEFAWVGLTERYDDSLKLLSYTFDWPPITDYKKHNVTKNPIKRDEIAPDIIQRIRELNQLDLQLYDYALELFDQRWAAMEASRRQDSKSAFTVPASSGKALPDNAQSNIKQIFDETTERIDGLFDDAFNSTFR
jgi:ubiquinone/menaquinone biosynthesis C-methylase UbiE